MPSDLPEQYLPSLRDTLIRAFLEISPEASLEDVVMLMSKPQNSNPQSQPNLPEKRIFGCVVVVENKRFSGLLTEREIVHWIAPGKKLSQVLVREVMKEKTITLTLSNSQNEDVSIALLMMRKHRIRYLPVLDSKGQVQGIVTSESISRLLQPANLFKLRRVKEVMTTQVVCASPTMSILEF